MAATLVTVHHISQKYTTFLHKYASRVLIFWGCLFLICLYPAKLFMDSTSLKYDAPKGTKGEIAMTEFKQIFPHGLHDKDIALLFDTKDKSPTLLSNKLSVEYLRAFLNELNTTAIEKGNSIQIQLMLGSYFLLNDMGASALAQYLLNTRSESTASAMIASIAIMKSEIPEGAPPMISYANWLDKEIERLSEKYFTKDKVAKNLRCRVTGLLSLARDLKEGTESDLLRVDGVAFPFALLVLAWVLRSFRALIIPMMCIGTTVIVSFALMYPVALVIDVISTAPSVMMSCAVSFSIDYSLFLLSRFGEETRKMSFKDIPLCIALMTDSAGHTILVSGATIMCCWFGLMFFPVSFLQSSGLGAGITILVTFLVNISLPAAMLLTYPSYFVPNTSIENSDMSAMNDQETLETGLIDSEEELSDISYQIQTLEKKSHWYAFARFMYGTLYRAIISFVVVSMICICFTPAALSLHHSESFQVFAPRSSPASKTANALTELYGGRMTPYSLLIEANPITNVLSNDYFMQIHDLIDNVLLKVKVPSATDSPDDVALLSSGISSLAYQRGYPILYKKTNRNEIGLLDCAEQVTVRFGSKCLAQFCKIETLACFADFTCDRNLACIYSCGANFECLASCYDAKRFDRASVALGKCALAHCVPKLNENENESTSVLESKVDSPKPDCLSVLVTAIQQVQIIPTVDEAKNRTSFKIGQGSFMVLELNIDAFGKLGGEWYDNLIRDLTERSKIDGNHYFLGGGNSAGHEMVHSVFGSFPIVIGIVMILVFLIVGFSFYSVFIPIRAIYSITLTLSIVYGTSVAVYEHDALKWTGIPAFINPVQGALSWLPTAMLFPVLVGLSLDYDIFLLTRIYECKTAGFPDHEAVIVGVARSGKIITAAATIMAIAFSGLFFSESAALNQCAFMLVVSVIVDSFIIRSIMVPSLMIIVGYIHPQANWWPKRF